MDIKSMVEYNNMNNLKRFKAELSKLEKRFNVVLYAGYLSALHDNHVIVKDSKNNIAVYLKTLTTEENWKRG